MNIQFLGARGARERDWRAWHDFATSKRECENERNTKKNLIVPMRWVDTDRADGMFDEAGKPKPFEAKSQLLVTGFRDKLLGFYRLAESMLLALTAATNMILESGDVKNAYLNGRQLAVTRSVSGTIRRRPALARHRTTVESEEGNLWIRRSIKTLLDPSVGEHGQGRLAKKLA